jgi:RNA polymerase sigma factor (TIGR02999 family)
VQTELRADVTHLIGLWSSGDRAAESKVFDALYRLMRQRAAFAMRSQRDGDMLSPTLLVHEAYLSLSGSIARGNFSVKDRSHFLKLAGRVMRNLVVDHVRAERAQSRGSGMERVEWNDSLMGVNQQPELILAVAAALDRLAVDNPRAAQLVEMRFFAGLSEQEVAEALQMSVRNARRYWTVAKTRLHEILSRDSTRPAAPGMFPDLASRAHTARVPYAD